MVTKPIWTLANGTLEWSVKPGQHHTDSYEMSGPYCDCIIGYGTAEDGQLWLDRSAYFPTLRTIPNDTHATLEVRPDPQKLPVLLCGGETVREYPIKFCLDGTLIAESRTDAGIRIRRQFYPSSQACCALERITVEAEQAVELALSQPQTVTLCSTLGTKGVYTARVRHNAPEQIELQPGMSVTFDMWLSATIGFGSEPIPNGAEELKKRYIRIKELTKEFLLLDSGIPELDAMVRFANLRAGESIFETLSGKFHSPGGRTYYAAVWCNDQVEYAGPHFAMTGDEAAIEASINAYRAYVPFMAESFAPIPSSVIAEGLDIWNGAGDRGDAAMYLYGASLFALYLGDRKVAEELYGPICWCAEYCYRRTSQEGIICSDTDELERRIPTDGYANLSASCLCYGGLLAASKLAASLGENAAAADFCQRAQALETAIEKYFGADLHGYHTYRYSKGYDTLRAWICLPLCMGIQERTEGTLDAMLSEYLWTEEGMLSCEISQDNQDRTIWDRSTLYGFRAAFAAGYGDRVMEPLLRYCRKRLLCDRVPYAVEAYPEGEKRHLSAESALFVRVITEGMLSIQPESLDSFSFVPQLSSGMPHLYLSGLRIAGYCWKIRVDRETWSVYRDDALVAGGQTDGKRVVIK